MAAAAAHLGLKCVLVLSGDVSPPYKGNAYLSRLFGADIWPVTSGEEREPTMAEVAAEIETGGGRTAPDRAYTVARHSLPHRRRRIRDLGARDQ
jgi:1-aminocyclopropane-1-carboxylate deaminase/D-cysteine desulfhydrase-like pyridoxal-dependent ACC family enzyme